MGYSKIQGAKMHAISGHQGTHAPPVPIPPLPPSLLCHQPEIGFPACFQSRAYEQRASHHRHQNGRGKKNHKKIRTSSRATPNSHNFFTLSLCTLPRDHTAAATPPPSPPSQNLPYNSQPPFANSIFHKWSAWHCQSHYYPPQRVFELNIRRVAITPLFTLFSLFVAVVGILLVQLMAKTSSGACDDKRHRFTGYSVLCSERTIDGALSPKNRRSKYIPVFNFCDIVRCATYKHSLCNL